MGRKALLLLAAVLLLTDVQAQKKTTETAEQNLQGRVRTLEEFEYNAETRDGTVSKDEEMGATSHHLTTFNRRGNIEEEKSFDSEKHMISKSKYKYSEVGDLMESSEYNEKNKLCGRIVYTYNSYRQYATQTVFLSDGSMEKGSYFYSSARLLDSTVWQTEGKKRMESYLYNAKQLLDEKNIFENGKWMEKNVYRYNAQGLIAEENFTSAEGKAHRTLYTYDEKDRILSISQQDGNGRQESRCCWTYDPYGNLLTETWYDENDRQTVHSHCEYTYDTQGNWTRQVWYDDGKAFTITERNITYF